MLPQSTVRAFAPHETADASPSSGFDARGLTGTLSWNLANGEMQWSPGVYAIAGVGRDVPPSRALVDGLTHPEDRIDDTDLLRAVRSGLYDYRLFRILRPNGELRWVSVRGYVVHDRHGEPEFMRALVVDETLAERQRQPMRVAERRLGAIGRHPALSILVADAAGALTDAPDWERLTGQDQRRARGAGWLAAVPAGERADVGRRWRDAVASATPFAADHHLLGPDGRARPVATRAMPVLDAGGQVREWIGVCMALPDPAAEAAEDVPPRALTGAHVRAARAYLGWSAADLAGRARVSLSTVRRIEESASGPAVRPALIKAVRDALAEAGIEFRPMPDGAVAICPPRAR